MHCSDPLQETQPLLQPLNFDLHVICDFFLLFSFFFGKTRFRDMGRKKPCEYCGVLVTVRSVTLQLCRWSETPTSLMVNNSNNDVKDNYTNDASSSSWEKKNKNKKKLKLKNGSGNPHLHARFSNWYLSMRSPSNNIAEMWGKINKVKPLQDTGVITEGFITIFTFAPTGWAWAC